MVHPEAQQRSVLVGAHLVLYDGVCGLCSRLLQFLLRHDRRHVFRCASCHSGSATARTTSWRGIDIACSDATTDVWSRVLSFAVGSSTVSGVERCGCPEFTEQSGGGC